MALADIEKRIITDAEKEAAAIRDKASTERASRKKIVQDELNRERKSREETLEQRAAQTVDQRKQLLQMEASQKVLEAKREHLNTVIAEVKKEIIEHEATRARFFKKVFADVAPQLVNEPSVSIETASANKDLVKGLIPLLHAKAEVVTHKDWTADRLEVVLTRARINCSVELVLREQVQGLEAQVAEILFG